MNWTKIIPRWGGTVVEPPEQKKTDGWIVGDKPPAFWENWFRKGVSESLTETQDNVDLCGDAIKGITGKGEVTDIPDITLAETKVIADDFIAHKAENVTDAHGLQYEEGIWTPVLYGSLVEGSNTYTVQSGTYVRNGNQITLNFLIELSSKDPGMSGQIRISGIPFIFNPSVFIVAGSISAVNNITLSAEYSQFTIFGVANSVEIRLASSGSNNSSLAITDSEIKNTSRISGSINYKI